MRLADFWAYARAGPDQDVDPLYLFDPDLPPGLEARFFCFSRNSDCVFAL